MTKIIAIDPGPVESAWIEYDTEHGPKAFGFEDNAAIRLQLYLWAVVCEDLVIEQVPHDGSGMAVGASVFDTCIQIGRFWEAWGRDPVLITRPAIKAQLCGTTRAKDSNVHQALVDRFGGKDKAVGGVKCRKCKGKGWYGGGRSVCPQCNGSKWHRYPPGPLHGITGHVWSALAVAVCWQEMQDPANSPTRPPPWSKTG